MLGQAQGDWGRAISGHILLFLMVLSHVRYTLLFFPFYFYFSFVFFFLFFFLLLLHRVRTLTIVHATFHLLDMVSCLR